MRSGPSPRSGHVGDRMEEFWIIFGGCGAKGRLNDIYAFNFETNVWICIDPGYQVSLHYYLQGIQYGFGAFYEKTNIDFDVRQFIPSFL